MTNYNITLKQDELDFLLEELTKLNNNIAEAEVLMNMANMLRKAKPDLATDEICKEMDDLTDQLPKKMDVVKRLVTLFTNTVNQKTENPSVKDSVLHCDVYVPYEQEFIPDINKSVDSNAVGYLYRADKKKLTGVFGLLSSYHTMVNVNRMSMDHVAISKSITDGRDYIWSLIESCK